MKKLLLLLLANFAFGQSVSLTENVTYGHDCSVVNTTTVTINGDLNLNGKTLNLRNVNLIILNNLNGGGTITYCGNSTLCVRGRIQNNPVLNGLNCNTLSTEEFNFSKDFGFKFKVFNILGEVILEGFTSENLFEKLPYDTLILLKVEGFQTIKLIKK